MKEHSLIQYIIVIREPKISRSTPPTALFGVSKPSKLIQNASSLNKTRKLVSWYLLAKYILPIKPVALHLISLAHAMQIKVS